VIPSPIILLTANIAHLKQLINQKIMKSNSKRTDLSPKLFVFAEDTVFSTI